jgi:hypothetical protein
MRAAHAKARRKTAIEEHPDWAELLVKAVTALGVISDAYRRFWNYSVGNQILALFQCLARGIEPGPIHTFVGWQELGRYVKKGEKALTLCMPVTVKCKDHKPPSDASNETQRPVDPDCEADDKGMIERSQRTCFIYRARWFVLSQTEGRDYVPAELPQWSEARALEELKIERVPFCHPNGNAQGYATGRQVAVSPLAFMPTRTLVHELAHVVLGHTEELQRMDDDDSQTPRDLREVEAECVALICSSSLPDRCDCSIDIRLTPNVTREVALQWVERLLAYIDREFPTPHATTLRSEESWPAYRLPTDEQIVMCVRESARAALGRDVPPVVCGPSNIGNFLATKGIPAICGFGVTYKNIHAADEYIELASIPPVYEVYKEAVLQYLTGTAGEVDELPHLR